MHTPPTYLASVTCKASNDGPAQLLLNGHWCGHGEQEFSVFDICMGGANTFRLLLPAFENEGLTPPVVIAETETGDTFSVYDSREHPASIYHPANNFRDNQVRATQPSSQDYYCCAVCGNNLFRVSVGFEIPSDSKEPNDTSWFALAVKCKSCGWSDIIYGDETA